MEIYPFLMFLSPYVALCGLEFWRTLINRQVGIVAALVRYIGRVFLGAVAAIGSIFLLASIFNDGGQANLIVMGVSVVAASVLIGWFNMRMIGVALIGALAVMMFVDPDMRDPSDFNGFFIVTSAIVVTYVLLAVVVPVRRRRQPASTHAPTYAPQQQPAAHYQRSDPQRRVFISYRRSVSWSVARAIFNDLHHQGYDVFMDVESIPSGQFEKIILNQINARPHFILILNRGTLDRVNEPGDWLRREIETALELKRNVVPVLVEGFTWEEAAPYLTGKLAQLQSYNGLPLPQEYFNEGLERLRTRFLRQPLQGQIVEAPASEHAMVQQHMVQVLNQARS